MNAILLATSILLQSPSEPVKSFYDVTVPNIDGKEVPLSSFKGKVVMVVNTASRCGLTPQFAGLEKLYGTYKKQGFVIIGFPANNFNGQEPGTNSEIKEFCTTKYKVSFPMMSKISVKGPDIHPLYSWLIAESDHPTNEIEWNFAKFILDRKGKVIKRFLPAEKPDSTWIKNAIEAALKAKA